MSQTERAPNQCFNIGLWNAPGSLKFYVSSQGADSSFIEPSSFDSIVEIPTDRLDNKISVPIKLLKVEAEGAEPEVLEGAEGILDSIEYISADLGYERGREQASTLAPVVNLLLSKGFELIDVNPGRVVALFRNKRLAA